MKKGDRLLFVEGLRESIMDNAGTLALYLEKWADILKIWIVARHSEYGEQCGKEDTQDTWKGMDRVNNKVKNRGCTHGWT